MGKGNCSRATALRHVVGRTIRGKNKAVIVPTKRCLDNTLFFPHNMSLHVRGGTGLVDAISPGRFPIVPAHFRNVRGE